MTPGCVKASAEIISNMDHTADPCDDFYQFACGGFIEKTVIPDDRTRMSSFSVLSDELLTQVRYYNLQCGNFRIFLSFRFYVKSILENVKVQKMSFWQFFDYRDTRAYILDLCIQEF